MSLLPETPLLDTINSPADLRLLSIDQLPQLCEEIRNFLIYSLADNPGHFASSMGAVELTVALHYVYNTPYDRLVWDVGHQAYGHKILTGRREAFANNRKKDGLSGFPHPQESEYDTFSAGHASNSISAGLGMAVASRLQDDNMRKVVAIIGDASIGGGLAFEGINNAANTPNNLLIVLNDNDMSIDRNVGALNSYLSRLTTSKGYNRLRYKLYQGLRRLHLMPDARKSAMLRFNNSLKSLITKQQNIFEGLNIRYFGPFDGHDIHELVRVLSSIRDMDGPRLLHLRTIKGKGYAPAEADPATWHAPGPFNPKTGERLCNKTEGKPLKFQDIFGKTLLELAQKDPKIVAITAAMPSGTSVSIMQAELPKRVFDVGISEGHAVTFAGGLAKEGMKPFVAIYSSFMQRAYDHIIHDVALQNLPVTFCLDRAGLVGEDGATHHGAYDLAYLRTIPGMTIAAPRDEHNLRNLLYTAAYTQHGPFAIRYPRGAGRNPDWQNEPKALPAGRGELLRKGNNVAILAIGPVALDALDAANQAAAQGVDTAVWDMIYLKPIDEDILRQAATIGKVIVVEDGTTNGGLGSATAEWISTNAPGTIIIRLGIPDRFIPQASPAEQHAMAGIDKVSILQAIFTIHNNCPFNTSNNASE